MKEIKVKCLSCGSLEGGDFCGTCHTVLPIEQEVDYFRLFGLEPRPAVDLPALKATFLNLSQKLHPDRNVQSILAEPETRERVLGVAAQLNQAFSTLSDTKERLRYLVGKAHGEEPAEANRVPAEIMELFFEVHDLMQEVDAHLKAKKPAGSRIVAAVAETDADKRRFLEAIGRMRARTLERFREVEEEVAEVDRGWDFAAERTGEREKLIVRLGELADVLAYLGRLKMSLAQKELALST
jgi:DnaJ-domain-containing protein 1